MSDPLHFPNPLFIMADVSHLLKNMRLAVVNAKEKGIRLPDWLVKEEKLPSNLVSVKVLESVLTVQGDRQLLLAPHLHDSTVHPTHFNKMKVKVARDFFSREVAAAIELLVEYKKIDETALTTAWFLEFIRRWHDLMSSRHPKTALSHFRHGQIQASY